MSDTAKDRLVTLGNRFASYEHANASKKEKSTSESIVPQQVSSTEEKTSFWKKSSNKVPGSAHLSTKGNKMHRFKTGSSSFRDFEGSTLDDWNESEDELRTPSSNDRSLYRPTMEKISSNETTNRHQNSARTQQHHNNVITQSVKEPEKVSRTASLKAMKLKISEKLGGVKGNNSKPSSPEESEQNNYAVPPTGYAMRESIGDLKDQESVRLEKFGKLLAGPNTDLDQLRKFSWNGIPVVVRGITWRLLSGYLPPNIDRRQATLERKQTEYRNFVEQYYPTRHDPLHQETYRQIHIDIPRTNPLIPIFQQKIVQELFERILFIWAIRHPASGYVQGINDLVVPFFVVFLSEHIDKEVETYNINHVKKEVLDMVEADSFWCFSKLLDGIQDNYTFAQPGIQMKVNALKNLVNRIDAPLNAHISSHNIDYLQFTFRWMNNLLMRELPLRASIRLWDTYWSEKDGFAMFHLYVCAAMVTKFSEEIKNKLEFQGVMMLLQNLPCKDWGDSEISCLVAEAYRLQFVFADAPKHIAKR